jgi:hypothetical protein
MITYPMLSDILSARKKIQSHKFPMNNLTSSRKCERACSRLNTVEKLRIWFSAFSFQRSPCIINQSSKAPEFGGQNILILKTTKPHHIHFTSLRLKTHAQGLSQAAQPAIQLYSITKKVLNRKHVSPSSVSLLCPSIFADADANISLAISLCAASNLALPSVGSATNATANAQFATPTFDPRPSFASAMSVLSATIRTSAWSAVARASRMRSTALSVRG